MPEYLMVDMGIPEVADVVNDLFRETNIVSVKELQQKMSMFKIDTTTLVERVHSRLTPHRAKRPDVHLYLTDNGTIHPLLYCYEK